MRASLILLLLATAAGCGRTVSEGDCTQIKENMRTAWSAEAKKATPPDPGGRDGEPGRGSPNPSERSAAVIRSEGDKLANDWMSECKRELMGRRVEPKEMDCLLSAKTIGDINKCSDL